MNKAVSLCIAIGAMLLTQYSVADESSEILDATDPGKIAAIVQDLGYRAKLEEDDEGDPIIRSSAGGSEFSIQFYGCSEDDHDQCTLLIFSVGYDLSDGMEDAPINEWNAMALVGRAYLDDEADPWLDWAVNMTGGISRENFEDGMSRWEQSVAEFEAHIGY